MLLFLQIERKVHNLYEEKFSDIYVNVGAVDGFLR